MRSEFIIRPDNPIISNHSVQGKRTFPGVAYIDIVYQCFVEKGFSLDELELRHLVIYEPMTFEQDAESMLLKFTFEETDKGVWTIKLEGTQQHVDTKSDSKHLLMTAEIHRSNVITFNTKLDKDSILRSPKSVLDLEQVYEACRTYQLVHTGYMKAKGRIIDTSDSIVMELSVGREAQEEADQFLVHPALIDSSAVGSGAWFHGIMAGEHGENSLYLPLYFESFKAVQPLGSSCLTRVKVDSVDRKDELLSMDLDFFDESGEKIGELIKFTNKRIRQAEDVKSGQPEEHIISEFTDNSDSPCALIQKDIIKYLKELLAGLLQRSDEQILANSGYYEMGLDSKNLLEAVRLISERVGSALTPTLLFEYTTIRQLADYLSDAHPQAFQSGTGFGENISKTGDEASPGGMDPRDVPTNAQSSEDPRASIREDVAVIGIAGRYPGSANLEEYWSNLVEGKDLIVEIPKNRWEWKDFESFRSPSGKSLSKWGGFLDDPDCFDASFFRVTPREAETLDPQERLFLETSWEAVEDAGYTPDTLVAPKGKNKRRSVGVFAGVMHKDYTLVGASAGKQFPIALNNAPIANRVSYFCNFHGPSMTLDTVCSSSLTAVHLALDSIALGECEVALAGGVNLSLHPGKYVSYGLADMHASDGRCRTFGKGGDGYVSGEGVGVVVLKPLRKAEEDGDHIYAVIKGSVINHVGTVSGITVPSPVAQGELIETCLEKTGIDPRTIGYIEAHGTGTSLGDPIEIQGLEKAFHRYTADVQYCSIGSVKSNIGHAESAAGIGGLHKVILQLHHRTLVPSLHSSESNPHIDFAHSPFYVQQKTEAWKRPVLMEQGVEKEYPLRAGISSFGATGSNAHLILEEYIPANPGKYDRKVENLTDQPVLIPLSAKNKERLSVYAAKLLDYLRGGKQTDLISKNPTLPSEEADTFGPSLDQLAFTLQVGRVAMEERAAFIVRTHSELMDKLTWIANAEEDSAQKGIWRGRVNESEQLIARDSTAKYIRDMSSEELARLARLWTQGAELDWLSFYNDNHPVRTSLPTYPFAKERYWVPDAVATETERRVEIQSFSSGANNHPLALKNTSKAGEIQYTAVFTGEELFLANHMIHGQRVLPGVVCLEMVRMAVSQERAVPDQHPIRFRHVQWANKAVVEESRLELHVGLLDGSDDIAFEVYQADRSLEGERKVICRGSVGLTSVNSTPEVDILSIQNESRDSYIEAQYIYDLYQRAGIVVGPAYRGIESVQIGNRQALAHLSQIDDMRENENFFLHPTLLDAALQASISLSVDDGHPLAAEVPFALESLEVYGSCRQVSKAWIRWSGDQLRGSLRKLDIDLLGKDGSVFVSLRGLTTRAIQRVDQAHVEHLSTMNIRSSMPIYQTGLLMLVPEWIEKQVTVLQEEEIELLEEEIHLVLLYEMDNLSTESLSAGLKGVRSIQVNSHTSDLDERFQFYSEHLFTHIQEMLTDRTNRQLRLQVILGVDSGNSVMAGLHSLLKTAKLENPRFNGQIIEMQKDESVSSITERLAADRSYNDAHIRYQEGNRYVSALREIRYESSDVDMLPWKDGGVYLLTGGAGGLGKIFAAEIALTVRNATLIIVGRSDLDLDKQAQLMELEIMGVHCQYRQADVTDKKAVEDMMHAIELEFGRLDGIIHSAGFIKDNYLIHKTVDELQTVIAPKVSGLVHLDEASERFRLDFFILFSSVAGAFGNPGQADYAAANAFMDVYADYRNGLSAAGRRSGITLSIGWPLWKEGGMHIDRAMEEEISRRTGMLPLETEAGIQAFYQAYSLNNSRVVVLSGYTEQVRSSLEDQEGMMRNESAQSGSEEYILQAEENELLEQKAIHELRKLIASVVKLPADRIEPDVTFEKYGLDSIAYMQITGELEKQFGTLSKTLFFEYPSLRAITGYFVKAYHKEMLEMLGLSGWNISEIQDGIKVGSKEDREKADSGTSGHDESVLLKEKSEPFSNSNMDIAIIGLDGRYPGARTVDEFWTRLVNGDDCITEIPQDRWEHRPIYDEDRSKPGKTYGKWGGFIEGVSEFDSQFFHISPREAEQMDPQERLFLQSVYSVMEDAGYTRESIGDQAKELGGNVGVYVGVMYDEYQLYGAQEQARGNAVTLSGNPATIANRVSYYFNFHGPSMTLGTMCSSSLTAIHLAVQSLRSGECEYAVAGGVNVSIHPNKYLMLGHGQFISSKGRCESFGSGGDGYVPGEGVGTVLLKPLGRAIADGDHIYGVIKATAINHGGKVAGYTVPNPNAQSAVIEKAIKDSGIEPRSIGYIEAHGTGTSLGDPIEITGLTNGFRSRTQDKQFCAIGSVKSNIGHCESAAGIAGITKILLQFKHGKLVPSLHSRVLNPNIDFAETPFYVQQECTDWKRPEDGKEAGKELARTAGVSSFGAGGANAHIILQEYMPWSDERENRLPDSRHPALIVLSAKDEDRLQERVQRLIRDLDLLPITDSQLMDMAYTLQIGREAMEQRLALTAASVDELKRKLTGYLNGEPDIAELYRNTIRPNNELSVLADEDMVHTVQAWLHKGKYTHLLQLWVKGLIIDWVILYEDWQPRRISLSTYPFAQERHWIQLTSGTTSVPGLLNHVLHPLVHRNTSDLVEQRYSSTFTGQEFYLHDHRIQGHSVMPGAAYLEMARAAVHLAHGAKEQYPSSWKIADVTWTRPFVIHRHEEELQISVIPNDRNEIEFVVSSSPDGTSGSPVIHSKGRLELDYHDNQLVRAPKRDIDRIRLEHNQYFDADTCYQFFAETGLQYGPSHQGIKALYASETTVLAELDLPDSAGELNSFIMHPALLDAAWQATIGFKLAAGGAADHTRELAMPVALEELVIWGKCSEHMLAVVRISPMFETASSLAKFDIDLCETDGTVCIQMKGLTCRILEIPDSVSPWAKKETLKVEAAEDTPLVLVPVWEAVTTETGETWSAEHARTLLVAGSGYNHELWYRQIPAIEPFIIKPSESTHDLSYRLSKLGKVDHVVWAAYDTNDKPSAIPSPEDKHGIETVLQAFRFIQALLRSGYGNQELGMTIMTSYGQMILKSEPVDPNQSSIHGFISSLAKEYPNWKIRMVDTNPGELPPLSEVMALPPDKEGLPWCYRRSEWYRRELVSAELPIPMKSTYRSGGVYVVIGGAGGIGEVWSEYMIRRYQAVIIWIGRREKDAVIQAKIDRLSTLGPAPIYLQANAADRSEMHQTYNWIKQRHDQIHGVIHAAIVLADQLIANMDESNFISVFNAKAKVSRQIEQTFQKEKLDFVLLFSSVNAFAGTPGQSNYVAGCAFKDAFAHQLSSRLVCPVKVVNWGYWGHHGAVSDEWNRERMSRMGIGSIEAEEAMDLLEKILEAPFNQVAYMKVKTDYSSVAIKTNDRIVVYKHAEALFNSDEEDRLLENLVMRHKANLAVNHEHVHKMEELMGQLLWCQMQSMNICQKSVVETNSMELPAGTQQQYNQWLKESFHVLERLGYLKRSDEIDHQWLITGTGPTDASVVWEEWAVQKEIWIQDPGMRAQVKLVETMLRALPEILNGSRRATDLMFPSSSMQLIEGIYKNNPVSDYFNDCLARTAVDYIQRRIQNDPNTTFRVLEVGAGTGGTSARMFEMLSLYQDHVKEYCYTDISQAFLLHGESEYASRLPYVKCRIMDVELPLSGQGIDEGAYDIVIATNVLHATRHIRTALRNIKAALRSNGVLLLNEIASKPLFTHLTFGLLEGWWLYEDPGLRIEGSPALSSTSWKVALEAEGYHSIRFPAAEYEEMGQQIVVAKSDGVIRLRESVPSVHENRPNRHMTAMRSLESIHEAGGQEMIREKTRAYLKQLVGETLKLSIDRIDTSERMEKYGIDSILIVRLTDKLRTVMSDVSSTLFFEYQTIDALADHLIHARPQELAELVGAVPVHVNAERNIERHINTFRLKRKAPSEQEKMLTTQSVSRDVAIIGLSGQYPRAKNAHQFWTNLLEGENCISEIPPERWDWRRYYNDEKGTSGSVYTKWGGFIEDMDCFDPKFFHISPREAMQMDPQERLFLQNAYASIEDAGYTPDMLSETGKVGVFVGVMNGNYPSGANYWSIANRVSYTLNFNGPSMAVDTACSSSLTAIILGMDSLYNGMSDVVICGGVNLIVDPVHYIRLSAAKMLSATDQCKAFGEHADGFVDGECVGAVVLKPLKKAVEDGDHIYGVIKGGSINSGGKTNGYTVPNPNAQQQAISDALKRSGIQPEMVSYVESHGTGTALGDPIEIAGLSKAFGERTDRKQYCAIGSVKSNIGHCESASGIAGLTKVIMQMKYETLVPSLHAENLNPEINFQSSPFKLQTERGPWRRPVIEQGGTYKEVPLIAGISSFGAGGANTHLIMEEYRPKSVKAHKAVGSQVQSAAIVLSAKNVDRLKERARQLLAHVLEHKITDENLPNVAYTLQIGREAMEERLAFVVDSISDLENRLKDFIAGSHSPGMHIGQVKSKNQAAAPADESSWMNLEINPCEKLASMWVKGYQVDWSLLYGTAKPGRISLPSYPFAKERYWVNANPVVDEASFSKESVKKGAPLVTNAPEVMPTRTDVNSVQLSGLQDIAHVIPKQKPVRIELTLLPQTERSSFEIKEESRTNPDFGPTPNLGPNQDLKVRLTPQQLTAELAQTLADALFMPLHEMDYDRSFIEMGMDSIIGVEWIQAVNKRYGLTISATKIYDFPTLREFSIYLADQLQVEDQAPSMVIEQTIPEIVAKKLESVPVTPTSMPSGLLIEELKGLLAQTLFMDQADVELEKSFIEMGMDSITGVEWIQLINKRYGTNISATKIYDYPTLREFSSFLMSELTPIPMTLDMVLEKVRQKAIPIEKAEQMLNSLLSSK